MLLPKSITAYPFLLTLCLVIVGCDGILPNFPGNDSGEPEESSHVSQDTEDENGSGGCREREIRIQSIDEALPNGGTAREILEHAKGKHHFVLKKKLESTLIDVYPDSAETPGWLSIEFDKSSMLYTTSVQSSSGDAIACIDRF